MPMAGKGMLLTSMNYSLSLGHAFTFLVAGLVASALLQTYRNLAGIAASPLAAGEERTHQDAHPEHEPDRARLRQVKEIIFVLSINH